MRPTSHSAPRYAGENNGRCGSKLSLSDTTTKRIEGGIRALVRGNRSVSASVTVPSEDNPAAGAASISVPTNVTVPSEDSLAAGVPSEDSLAAGVPGEDSLAAGAASIADIERLIAELLVARDYLQAEGERVRRVNANYAHFGADRIGLGQDHCREHWQMARPAAKFSEADLLGEWRDPRTGPQSGSRRELQ